MKNCSYRNLKVRGEIFLLFNASDKFNSNVKKWLQFFYKKKKTLIIMHVTKYVQFKNRDA